LLVGYIFVQGAPAISWEFVTGLPRDGMRAGGVWPAVVGTLLLTLGTAIFAVPVGVAVAIYLAEYARDTFFTRLIRLAIINLAGVPSVVYGLFGLGLFVIFLRFGTSILAGSLTLAIMTLPVIILSHRQPIAGDHAMADHPARHPASGPAGCPHRHYPGVGTGGGGDGADPLYRGGLFPAAPAQFDLRSDHGAPVPPVCHQYAGAGDAGAHPVRDGVGPADLCAFDERPGGGDAQPLPPQETMVNGERPMAGR
jgi:hypothetical protein